MNKLGTLGAAIALSTASYGIANAQDIMTHEKANCSQSCHTDPNLNRKIISGMSARIGVTPEVAKQILRTREDIGQKCHLNRFGTNFHFTHSPLKQTNQPGISVVDKLSAFINGREVQANIQSIIRPNGVLSFVYIDQNGTACRITKPDSNGNSRTVIDRNPSQRFTHDISNFQ